MLLQQGCRRAECARLSGGVAGLVFCYCTQQEVFANSFLNILERAREECIEIRSSNIVGLIGRLPVYMVMCADSGSAPWLPTWKGTDPEGLQSMPCQWPMR